MDSKELEALILKWIGENYGSQEQDDPCYDIGSLSGVIASAQRKKEELPQGKWKNENKRHVYNQMCNLWYNDFEIYDPSIYGVSDFDAWCADNVHNEEQQELVKALAHHVDAITDILFDDGERQ